MSNFGGTWKIKSSENFDELLKALGKLFLSFPRLYYQHQCMSQTRHALEPASVSLPQRVRNDPLNGAIALTSVKSNDWAVVEEKSQNELFAWRTDTPAAICISVFRIAFGLSQRLYSRGTHTDLSVCHTNS